MALRVKWEVVSALAATASFIISIVALYSATTGTDATNKIAAEALKIARQANAISLGVAREPAVVEFADPNDSSYFTFDFTDTKAFKGDLKEIVTIRNTGEKPVDALGVEVIGVDGLTYSLSDPMARIDHLPYYSARLNLTSALQPGALAHIDVRSFILNYLTKLTPILPHNEGTYSAVVNIVLAPKAINEPTPIPAGSVTKNDRRLLTIKFLPSVIRSPEANSVLESKEIPQRIFSN